MNLAGMMRKSFGSMAGGAAAAYALAYYAWIWAFRGDARLLTLGSDSLSLVGVLLAVTMMSRVHAGSDDDERSFWFFMLLGAISYAIGVSIWFFYDNILGREPFSPGFQDVFFVSIPAYMVCAICRFVNLRKKLLFGIKTLLDVLICMVATVSLSMDFIIRPILSGEDGLSFGTLVALLYPVSDIGLIFALLCLELTSTVFSFRMRFMLSGLLLYVVADVGYVYLLSVGNFDAGSFVNPLWGAAWLLIAFSGRDVRPRSVDEAPEKGRIPWRLVRRTLDMALPYLFLLALVALIATEIGDVGGTLIGALAAILLVVVRQIVSLVENARLVEDLKASNRELEIGKRILEFRHERLKQLSATIEAEARTDFLTNLYNRRYVDEILYSLRDQVLLNRITFSILMIDIDRFKSINDGYGHAAGDEVLRRFSEILHGRFRGNEIVGRFGGDEFAVFLPGVELPEAGRIAERVRESVAGHVFPVGEHAIACTVSIGVAQWEDSDADVHSIVRRADNALYEAKAAGRNRTTLAAPPGERASRIEEACASAAAEA